MCRRLTSPTRFVAVLDLKLLKSKTYELHGAPLLIAVCLRIPSLVHDLKAVQQRLCPLDKYFVIKGP